MKFEHLCRDLVEEEYPDDIVRTSLKRKSGLAQYGVDVEGFDADGEHAILVSAKCYEQTKASYFKGWLLDFTKHLGGHWKGRRIRFFIMAVATETNDDDINEAVRQAAAELKPHGIEFRLWNANTITRRLRRARALVDQYFHPVWASAISAEPATTATLVASASPGIAVPGWLHQAMAHVEGVSGSLGKALASSLDSALAAVRSGRSDALRGWYEDNRAQVEAWALLDPAVKARALRAVAMLRLHDDDVAGAGELLDEADLLPAPPDASSRARYVRATDGADAALALLDDPRAPRERETKAVILIEAGRVTEADTVLSVASGEEVTPEILRLRAIVRLLTGHIPRATADAISAVARAPGELGPLLTRATVRFHAALVAGARPQVGRAPELVQAGLVREGAGARAELSAAADEFAMVANLAEDDLRADIEIWRLAALLLNPAREEEGAALARKLLEAPLPEALAVAWAWSFGVVDRPGRLKRVLGAALRDGRANESHLVVLAMLCAGNDNPKRGLEQIRRHEGRFPAAAAFLEGWRARFGDPDASGDADHATATRRALRTGDFEPVVASALAEGATAETVLLAAEFLAWRGYWRGLDRLRAPLSALPTVRALELAALAALRSGDFVGCLAVLDGGLRSIESAVLPRPLVYLRMAANEALGRHEPLLADLFYLRGDGDDAGTQDRIMDEYVRIGDLDRLSQEVETALDRSTLDPRRALSLAYVLRASAPATARRALLRATEDIIPPEVAGAALSLAAELNVPGVRETMMRTVIADPGANHVTRFDRFEDVIAFMEGSAREHRVRFGEWRKGRVPFALTTAWDVETFGRMFLAEPAYRRDRLRDPFPMLLTSAARRAASSPLPTGTLLRPDLGALLLANRLGLLSHLEGAFTLQVPGSAAEALVELEAVFRRPSPEIIASARNVLEGRGAVRLASPLPIGAVTVEDGETPGELSKAVVRALLERAFAEGHLDRGSLEGAASRLEAPAGEVAVVDDGVVMTRLAVTRLAGAGVLEQVARATPCYISITAEELDTVEATEAVDDRFALLRRLMDGNLDRTLRLMGERSTSQGTVRLSDFELPPPEVVLAHLRLPAGTSADAFVATAWSGLMGMPSCEASRRIASIPLGTSGSDLGLSDVQLAGEARTRMSPMLAAFDLLRLIAADPSEAEIERGVATLVSSLEHQAAFLTAVIRHLAAAAARDDAWRALDPTSRISLLWCHADQVVQYLSPPGHDFRSVAHWLEGNTSFPFLDRIGESGMPPWYGRATVGLTEVRLIGALVSRVLGAGSTVWSEAAEIALRNTCGTASGDAWSPSVDLLSPPPVGPEILWVAADPLRADLLGRWLSPDNPLGLRSDDGLATGVLNSEFGPDTAHLLGPRLSYVDVRNVAPATADRMRKAIVAGGGTSAFEPNMVATHRIMLVDMRLRALQGDEAGMRAVLAAEARRCASQWPGAAVGIGSDDGASAALTILVEAALEFALRLSRSLPERFGVFAEGIRAIVDAWPASRGAATARLDAAVRLGGAEEASALWPVLLNLRGRL